MGRDKAQLEIGGEPIVARTARLIAEAAGGAAIVGNSGANQALGLHTIADDSPGAGPLGGILTALHAADTPWSLIVATDLPYLTREWLDYLVARGLASSADAVMATNERGRQPLCAMYHRRAEAPLRSAFERGTRSVLAALREIRVEEIAPAEWNRFDSAGFLFKNMNSPDDYEEARARLAERPG